MRMSGEKVIGEAASESKTQGGKANGEIFMRERDSRTVRNETKTQTDTRHSTALHLCVCG